MFDIGFWELAVIVVVALLVVGPNDLPKVVRTVGSWITKVRNFMHNVGVQLDEEVGKIEDVRRLLAKEAELDRPGKGAAPGAKSAADAPGAAQGGRSGQGGAGGAATEGKAAPPAGESHGGTR